MGDIIKALPTEYRGIKFRSRTEAKWAVLFDEIGAHWEYEPQGYNIGDVNYMPDFKVFFSNVDFPIWFEVKGVMTEQDAQKFRTFSKPLHPLVLLGQIPLPEIWKDSWSAYSFFNNSLNIQQIANLYKYPDIRPWCYTEYNPNWWKARAISCSCVPAISVNNRPIILTNHSQYEDLLDAKKTYEAYSRANNMKFNTYY